MIDNLMEVASTECFLGVLTTVDNTGRLVE